MSIRMNKFKLFSVITFALLSMFFIFPQNNAYAGGIWDAVANGVYDFMTGNGNIESEFFEKAIEDAVKEDINIVGFDTHRFETEEQAAKFRAAVISQQFENLVEDFMNSKSLNEKWEIVTNLKQHLSDNLQKSVEQVNKMIEDNGGNIDNVTFDYENINIFGIQVGKKLNDLFKNVTPDDYANLRKLDEQLTREAYAELGVDELPQDILEGLFNMSNNKEEFWENFKNMSQSDKDWFEESKAYYAYSAELTDDGIALMEAAGISNMDELKQFYMNNKSKIKNMEDLKTLVSQMQKDREHLMTLLDKATVATSKDIPLNSNVNTNTMILDNGLLTLLMTNKPNINNPSGFGVYCGIRFDNVDDYNAFRIAWEAFKDKYNWEFTSASPNFQKLFTFYQTSPGNLNDTIKLAGDIDVETHTFVSKIIFTITKKSGPISGMTVASQDELNKVALQYNKKFAEAYKYLTGNACPTPTIISNDGNSIVVELNYYNGIAKQHPGNEVYDYIRNYWSLITGKHARTSLDYRNSFIPTMVFDNVKERGVYEITAVVYGSRYYQYEKTYTYYYNCTTDEDGHHVHGDSSIIEYFPYRQKYNGVHSHPTDNDMRGVAPDNIEEDHIIARAMWEVNVKEKGKIIVPAVGVDNTDIKISNFISE